jgi:CRP/FNR family transcriptional regulator
MEGEPDAPVFVVREGSVRVFRTSLEGREQTLILLGAGAAINVPMAFLSTGRFAAAQGKPAAPASAVALSPVELAVVSRSDFCRTVIHTPALALVVLRDLAFKISHLTDLSRDLGLLSVRARLAGFLLSRGQSQGDPSAPSTHVRWTHQEIANQIGTVREVVSRTMRAFVKEGLIKLDRHRIVILDRDALLRESEA